MSDLLNILGVGSLFQQQLYRNQQQYTNASLAAMQQGATIGPSRYCPHERHCLVCEDEADAAAHAEALAQTVRQIAAVYDAAHYENRCRDFLTHWRQGNTVTHAEGR